MPVTHHYCNVVYFRAFTRRVTLSLLVLSGLGASTLRAQNVAHVIVSKDTNRRELVFRIGPVDIPSTGSHEAIRQAGALRARIPVDGWLQGYRVELVDASGRQVPQNVLHHLNIIQPEKRELFSNIMQRVGAAAEETPPVSMPGVIGYRVHAGEHLLLKAMLHNPTDQAYNGVSVVLRMRYSPDDGVLDPISIFPFYVDVMPPAGIHAFDLPPGRSTRIWEGKPAVSGRILVMGGHVHAYGESLRFEDVTAKKVIWEGRPPVDEHGKLAPMPLRKYFWRLGLPIQSNHVYRLTATYDNPTGKHIPAGGMGTLGGVFLPTAGRWPSIAENHPEYQKDIRVTVHDEDAIAGMHHGASEPEAAANHHEH